MSQMKEDASLLVQESLQETVYRLEETRLGFRKSSAEETRKALNWILGRQGLKYSYRGLFAPTEKDMAEGLQTLTGEQFPGRNALSRHILGEEALRAIILWNRSSDPAAVKALKAYEKIVNLSEDGTFCCYNCTIAFLRTLTAAKVGNWSETLYKEIGKIRKKRTSNGRWHGFPFFYTLLALSEIDVPSAKDELQHASNAAKKLIKKYKQKDDRTSCFRTLALEASINAL
ncbi:hypothetical protein KEJ18_04810 [Candidatus Bathyarchaeota archaeon]|nr:hypothetical protein [Candidatus Bathyarchaeota archaeon]